MWKASTPCEVLRGWTLSYGVERGLWEVFTIKSITKVKPRSECNEMLRALFPVSLGALASKKALGHAQALESPGL